jgi:hypothetical protein
MMLRHLRKFPVCNSAVQVIPKRFLSISQFFSEKALPPRLKLLDADITTSYLKGTGPGGQKIVRIYLPLPSPHLCPVLLPSQHYLFIAR